MSLSTMPQSFRVRKRGSTRLPSRTVAHQAALPNPSLPILAGDVLVRTEPNATLLAAARATVVAVNTLTKWAPLNGFCMAWPPAVRIMDSANASWIIAGMTVALSATMYPNYWPQVRGRAVT